jgi:hypothetical protein
VPVVFEAEAAGGFIQGLFGAFSGLNVLEQRSFLAGRKGSRSAPRSSPSWTTRSCAAGSARAPSTAKDRRRGARRGRPRRS